MATSPERTDSNVSDLVAIAYKDLDTAQRVAGNLGEAVKEHLIELDDMVVVEHRDDGKVKLHQPSLAGVGAAGGALWGGLIGLIFFVPLLGMAIGAASGAAAGALSDTGVDDEFMKKLGDELDPGAAAVIVLVRRVTAGQGAARRSRSRARSSRRRCPTRTSRRCRTRWPLRTRATPRPTSQVMDGMGAAAYRGAHERLRHRPPSLR